MVENKTSLILMESPFIVPGGRFREMYYWDTYWTILGLIQSEMTQTVKGKCERSTVTLQGDTARCLKPPVDFSTEVPFWPGLPWPSQAKVELLF